MRMGFKSTLQGSMSSHSRMPTIFEVYRKLRLLNVRQKELKSWIQSYCL
jgi:hypothetical protein